MRWEGDMGVAIHPEGKRACSTHPVGDWEKEVEKFRKELRTAVTAVRCALMFL